MALWAELPRNHVNEPNTVRASRRVGMGQAGRWIYRVNPLFSAEVEDEDLVVNRTKVLVATNNIEPIAHLGAGSIIQCAGAFSAPRPARTNRSMMNAL